MASIRKLPSGRFNCQLRRKRLGTLSRSFDTLHEAELWAAQQESLASPSVQQGSRLTFRDIAYMYLARALQGRPFAGNKFSVER